ncbi:hypothetical protein V8C35DRAFT_297794 [Trichoderma chlorosporum]
MKASVVIAAACAAVATALPAHHREHHGNSTTGHWNTSTPSWNLTTIGSGTVTIIPKGGIAPGGPLFPNTTSSLNATWAKHKHLETHHKHNETHEHHKHNETHIPIPWLRLPRDQRKALSNAALRG